MLDNWQTIQLGNLLLHHKVTNVQCEIAARLMEKGWIEPWVYGGCVRLALPDLWHKKHRGVIFRDWSRKSIRITKTGRILCN